MNIEIYFLEVDPVANKNIKAFLIVPKRRKQLSVICIQINAAKVENL